MNKIFILFILMNLIGCKQNLQEKVHPNLNETEQIKPNMEKQVESSFQIAANELGISVERPVFWPGFYGNTYKMFDEEGLIKNITAFGDGGELVHAIQFEFNNNQELVLIKETFQGETKNISFSSLGDNIYESSNIRINMKDGLISKLIQFNSDEKTDFAFAYCSVQLDLHVVIIQEVDSQEMVYKSAFEGELISSEYLDDMVDDFNQFIAAKNY